MNKKIEIKQLKSDEDRTNAMDNHSFEMYRDEKGTNLYLLDYISYGVVEIRNEDQLKDLFSVLLYDDESTVQHDNEIKVNARIISNNWKEIDNKIKTDSITVDDINQMNWPKTNAGDEAKKTAIGKVVLYKKGMPETESNVNELLEVRKLISENKIRDKFTKFWFMFSP